MCITCACTIPILFSLLLFIFPKMLMPKYLFMIIHCVRQKLWYDRLPLSVCELFLHVIQQSDKLYTIQPMMFIEAECLALRLRGLLCCMVLEVKTCNLRNCALSLRCIHSK